MRKKIIFVPGWTRSMKFYKYYEGVEAWKSEIPLPEKIEADYIIAHSLGVNLLLGGLIFNRDAKIILINPLLSEEKTSQWIWRWIKFVLFGSPKIDWHMNPLNTFSSYKKFRKLKKNNYTDLLEKTLPKNVTIIRGKKDYFFCDEKEAEKIKKNWRVIEMDGLGHEWNEKFNDVINKIVNK